MKLIFNLNKKYTRKIPNKTTLKAIKNVEKRKGLVKAKNVKDLFKKLGI